MLRRLHPDQPDSFAFTPANQAWAEAQATKYPEGRQASAIIPLLWRAQEQEGWLTRPAIEHVAGMLDMAYMRALEVASFYFMFQLQPVGSVAHIQVCGTTSCMICGAEDLIGVCREKIAAKPHEISADGKLSWEEVECLGACANAPMAQIGKDYYEDLTAEGFAAMIDQLRAGDVPVPGPQNGRYTSEPKMGLTSLKDFAKNPHQYNASAQMATDIGDSVKRIDGTEVPLVAPWGDAGGRVRGSDGAANEATAPKAAKAPAAKAAPKPDARADKDVVGEASDKHSEIPGEAPKTDAVAKPPIDGTQGTEPAETRTKPQTLDGARDGGADDLKQIKGIGPKLEQLCNSLGFYHFDQIAGWSADEIAWVDANLEGFKGRVSRDNWVDQAKTLASGAETEFSSRVKKGDVYDT